MKIKKHYFFISLAVTLGIIIYLSRQNHNNFEKSIVNLAQSHLLLIAHSEAQSIEKYINNIQQELEILSSQKTIQRNIFQNYTPEAKEDFSYLDDSYKDVGGLVDSLSLIDAKGTVRYVSPFKEELISQDLSGVPDIKMALGNHRIYTGEIFKMPPDMQVFTLDQPVFQGGEFIGLIRAVIRIDKINDLVKHINEGENRYAFLIDKRGDVLSYPAFCCLGMNVSEVIKGDTSESCRLKIKEFIGRLKNGQDGAGIYSFSAAGYNPKNTETLVAFSPIHINDNTWSLVVAASYNSIAGPININGRDNVVFAGFVSLLFIIAGWIFYQDQKKRADELENIYKQLERSHAELKAAQSMLIQSEKMEIVGKLAAGVAHEVKNPLAIILQGIEYLKSKVRQDDEHVPSVLNDIEQAVISADDVVKGLLDFSSVTTLDIKPQELHPIIDKTLMLIKNILDKNNIKITKNYREDIPPVKLDKNKIEQILVNLFLNAAQAMPNGGELAVTTYLDQRQNQGTRCAIQIDDTGTGIPEDDLKKIFEPFFSTKRAIGGTGLGLPIVRNIIEMHNGTITISNRKDSHGLRVTVMLRV